VLAVSLLICFKEVYSGPFHILKLTNDPFKAKKQSSSATAPKSFVFASQP
jgi:hypothetical protein